MNQNIDNNQADVTQAGRDIKESFFNLADPASLSNRINWLLAFSTILVILQFGSLGKSIVLKHQSADNPNKIISIVRDIIKESNSNLLLELNNNLEYKLTLLEGRISKDRKYDIVNVEQRIVRDRNEKLKELELRLTNKINESINKK